MTTIFGYEAQLLLNVPGYGKVNVARAIRIKGDGIAIEPDVVLAEIADAKQRKDIRRRVKAEVDRQMAERNQ